MTDVPQTTAVRSFNEETDKDVPLVKVMPHEQIFKAITFGGKCPTCATPFEFSIINAAPVVQQLFIGRRVVVAPCPTCNKPFSVEKSILVDGSKLTTTDISKLGKKKAAGGLHIVGGPKNGSAA